MTKQKVTKQKVTKQTNETSFVTYDDSSIDLSKTEKNDFNRLEKYLESNKQFKALAALEELKRLISIEHNKNHTIEKTLDKVLKRIKTEIMIGIPTI